MAQASQFEARLDQAATDAELDAIFPKGALRSKQRKPLSEDELRQLADFYRATTARGQLPTKLLARRFHLDPGTRSALVAEMRGGWLLEV